MDPWYIDPVHITIRLVLALIAGGLIGFEREMNSSAAGLRTHILVCIGSSLVMLISIYGFHDFVNEVNVRVDPSRLAAQVVSGIGFLGAGTILITGNVIKGLTTAASLWIVAAIGLAIGAGFYYPAILVSVLVIISLWILSKVEKRFLRAKKQQILKIEMPDTGGLMSRFSVILAACGAETRKVSIDAVAGSELIAISYTILIARPNIAGLIDQVRSVEGVSRVTIE